MQVVIAMSGFGERFRRAGYEIPKPLIEVEGRPIISHVVDMFPGDNDFIFICNQDHLAEPEFRMEAILKEICPTGQIIAIEPHKLGPVHAVLSAQPSIDLDQPTIINYCDFTCYWDFNHFAQQVIQADCDGAIPCYTGFHPHMLGSTNYAYVRETNGWVEDIQEKQPYTDQPMQEYASSGTYFFRTGKLAIKYCQRVKDEKLDLNGEYYVSLVYKPMLSDECRVMVYPIQHFMQWGTPEDLAVYRDWSRVFEQLAQNPATPPQQNGAVMVPLAGLGSRFTKEGYTDPKPLVSVSGAPMVIQATCDLPNAQSHVFVLREDLPGRERIETALSNAFPKVCLNVLDDLTDGQARTCLLALDQVGLEQPLTIGACDNGALYDSQKLAALLDDPDVDVIIWVARHHPNAARHPEMYGWVNAVGDKVTSVSVKQPLDDPINDPIIIGTFTFNQAKDFKASAERMIERDAKVNGEYYVDTCINDAIALGLTCRLFEVDAYLCWGTPDELHTFEYWQSCFHKWKGHPYQLENDSRVPREVCIELENRYKFLPPQPPGDWPRKQDGGLSQSSQNVCDVSQSENHERSSTAKNSSSTSKFSKLTIGILPSIGPLSFLHTAVGRFLIVGITTVVIDLCTYMILMSFGLSIAQAKALGFIAGTIFAYFANRLYTFQTYGSAQRFGLFVILYVFTLLVNVGANQYLLHVLNDIPFDLLLAFLIATGLSATLNYLGMKRVIFNDKNKVELKSR